MIEVKSQAIERKEFYYQSHDEKTKHIKEMVAAGWSKVFEARFSFTVVFERVKS